MPVSGRVARWDAALFGEVLDAIRSERLRYFVVRIPGGHPPLPTSAGLSALVEAALAGSLKREEGRDVRFTLVYSPDDSSGAFRFNGREPLEAEVIRRIAPAVHPTLGLGVSSTDDSPLGIWGLARRRQDAVEVTAVAPGRVVVRFGLSNIARFEGLECHLTRSGATQLLEALEPLLASPADEGDDERYVLLFYLVQLANATRAQGHGGAFLLVPQEGSGVLEGLRPRFPFQPPFRDLAERCAQSRALFREAARDDEGPLYTLTLLPDAEAVLVGGVPSPASDLIATVGQFASVDGVVLLHRDLSVLGLGAFIDDEATSLEESWLEWQPGSPDWQRRDGPAKELGGTRHQSAFAFVKKHRGALAVVCSQDGAIMMLAQPQTREILVARDIDRALG